jgi:hypothetical protein
MSNDEAGKPRPPVSWATIERVADRHEREEMELLLAKSDEELDAELKEAGFAPDDAANLVTAALDKVPALAPAPASAPAKVVSLAAERQRRGRGVGWLALVAAAVAVLVLGGGGAIVALRTPEPAPTTTPGPSIAPTPPRPPPEVLAKEEADGLRRRALTECAAKQWGGCVGDLDQAAKLDPASDEGALRRLRGKAGREFGAEQLEAKAGPLTGRSLLPDVRKPLAEALATRAGQPVRVVCARGPEPERYCGQLAAVLTKAGWVVTREAAAREAGVSYGLAITVAEGSDEATEDAAEALADRLEWAGVRARGPDDAPASGGEGPAVTLTVGAP